MDTDYMDDIHVALQSLLLLARMEELRAGSAADYSGAALDWDIQYECVYDLYNRAFDICAMSYSEAWCEERIYVSAHSMVEFYKLCREHAVLLRCKLEDEPYYKEAEEFVDNVMAEAAGYLYDMEAAWVDVDSNYPKVIPNKELPKLKKIHDAHVKKLKGMQPQEPLSKEMPAALPSAQMPPASKPLPQYVVRKTEKHRFSHVVHQVIDLEQENGDIITVFLSDVNQEVRPGSILQNVKIGAHEGKQDAKKIFYTLDEYQIAA